MCETIEELNKNIKTKFSVFENAIYARFDSLEKALIIHAETPPAVLSPLLLEIKNDIKEIKVQTTKTNGRVTRLELWKANIKGGKVVFTGIWAFLSIFIVAGIFGLFNMYQTMEKMPYLIREEVSKNMEK